MSTLSVDTITGQTAAANVKLPAGTILQTVSASSSGVLQHNSATFTNLPGMTITIAPKFSNSKLIFWVQIHGYINTGGQVWQGGDIRIIRTDNSTTFMNPYSSGNGYGFAHAGGGTSAHRIMDYMTRTAEHLPASTASKTYNIQWRNTDASTGTHDINEPTYGGGGHMICQEISI